MHTNLFRFGLLFTLFLALMTACSGPSLHMRYVPENGYERTLYYEFQAQTFEDSEGTCKKLTVQVKSISRNYSSAILPERLQLFDDDCHKPFRFERAQYLSRVTGKHERLSDFEVTRFLADFPRLESDLIGWLWREGI